MSQINKYKVKTIQVDEIQPYKNMYKEDLVRIGVVEGNIFHAAMVAYSDRYLKSTLDKRIETVKMIRECIGNSITRKQWQSLQDTIPGLVSKQFIKTVHTLQSTNFKAIHSIDNKELCKILLDLLFSSRVLHEVTLNRPNIEQITDLVTLSVKEMLRDTDTKRSNFFIENMVRFVNDAWIDAKNNSFEQFKQSVKNYNETVGDEVIPLISSVLNRDVYVFKDGRLKNGQGEDSFKGRKSILIDQLSDTQYSTIGKRLFSSDVEWSFEPDSTLIRKVNPYRPLIRSPMETERKVRRDLPKLSENNEIVKEDTDKNEVKETENEELEEIEEKEEIELKSN